MGHRLSRGAAMAAVLLAVFTASPLYSQQAGTNPLPVVVLSQLTSSSDNVVAARLAGTITNSIDLELRLTNTLQVRRADFLLPQQSLERAVKYYRQEGAVAAIYGSVDGGSDGSYVVDLEIWNSANSTSRPALVLRRRISNLLDSFSLADQLSLEVASRVVGRKLSDGTLVVENVAGMPDYSVYADRHLLGRNRSSFRLLSGKREIIVAKPGILGDQAVQVFHVSILANKTTTIRLSTRETGAPTPDIKLPTRGATTAATSKPTTPSSASKSVAPSSTGAIVVTAKTGGMLFVDGEGGRSIYPGQPLTIHNLSPSLHELTMVYNDGHAEHLSVSLLAPTDRVDATFVYVSTHEHSVASENQAAATGVAPRRSQTRHLYLGVDLGEAIIVSLASLAQGNGQIYFGVFELDTRYLIRKHLGVSGELFYRVNSSPGGVPPLESQEIAGAVGPVWFFNGEFGPFIEMKVGAGYMFGTYDNAPYSRVDLVLQPEVGVVQRMSGHLTFAMELGVQSLLPIRENPVIPDAWWGPIGMLSQYYLPVLDVSLGWRL